MPAAEAAHALASSQRTNPAAPAEVQKPEAGREMVAPASASREALSPQNQYAATVGIDKGPSDKAPAAAIDNGGINFTSYESGLSDILSLKSQILPPGSIGGAAGSDQQPPNPSLAVKKSASGQIVSYTDPSGRVFTEHNGQFADAAGDTLTASTQSAQHPGLTTQDETDRHYLVANSDHKPIEEIYKNGQTRQFGYDSSGKLDSITQPDGQELKLTNGQWTDNGSPSGFSHVQLTSDGTLSYQTADGDKVHLAFDGTSTTQLSTGGFINRNLQGQISSTVSNTGDLHQFAYDEHGKLNWLVDNGKSYTLQAKDVWFGQDGAPSQKQDFMLDAQGGLQYYNVSTFHVITHSLDGTKTTQFDNGSAIKTDAQGRTIAVTAAHEVTSAKDAAPAEPARQMTFSYDSKGQMSKFSTYDGQTYARQSDGTFSGSNGNKISDVHLGAEGNLTYANSSGHLIVSARVGTVSSSTETVDQLNADARKINQHTGADVLNLLNKTIQNMGNTDMVALQNQYQALYGADLGGRVAPLPDAEPAVRKLFEADLSTVVTAKNLTQWLRTGRPDTVSDPGQPIQDELTLAAHSDLPVAPAVAGALDRTALSLSEQNISADGVDQSAYGDCYFISALAGVAGANGGATIKNMVKANADGTYSVTFDQPNFTTENVNVTQADIEKYHTNDSALWANVVETAFLKQDNGNFMAGAVYGRGADGPENEDWLNYGHGLFTHGSNIDFSTPTLSQSQLADYLKQGNVVTAGTSDNEPQDSPIVGQHAYTVVGVDSKTGTVTLRNPWGVINDNHQKEGETVQGVKNEGKGYLSMSYQTFVQHFQNVDVSAQQ